MNELESLLILNAVPGLGNMRIRKLLEGLGSAEDILSASEKELSATGLPSKVVQSIIRFDKEEFLKKEQELMHKEDVRALSFLEKDYPDLLSKIPDAPVVLYVKGDIKKEDNTAVSLVGSRKASFYGTSVAEKFAFNLAGLGITIVSGMARGIDTATHEGALKANGRTIAVLGSGLAKIYPPENKKLFLKIAEARAVVSEFPMTTAPAAFNFPRRNRIISGLSLGVVVVEASAKSGALITSRFALEQGREVFAVPGKVDSPTSRGTHELIKQGAKLVHSVEDILEEIAPQLKSQLKDTGTQNDFESGATLSEKEKSIFNFLSSDATHVDEIASHASCSIPEVMSILLRLELKHLIRQLPGKFFVKNKTQRETLLTR